MRRLLQGDVGSGKTIVAACCALMAIESGRDVALMAPTEILAEQHYTNFSRWLDSLGVTIGLYTSSHKTHGSKSGLQGGEKNHASTRSRGSLTIGTHALLGSGFEQSNLGLVIIDEQHKFGVSQREQLVRKGQYPHLLVMTATPIPRTLGSHALRRFGPFHYRSVAARARPHSDLCSDSRLFAQGLDFCPKPIKGKTASLCGVSAHRTEPR